MEDEEFTVEAILGWRHNLQLEEKQYLIKWENWPESNNTWEPESNLDCPVILGKFIKGLRGRQRRNFTRDPSKLNGFQRNATFVGIVGTREKNDLDIDSDLRSEDDDKPPYYLVVFDDNVKDDGTVEPECLTLKEILDAETVDEYCKRAEYLLNKIDEIA